MGRARSETFFKQNLVREGELVDESSFIHIAGAQGLDVPYLGYVELDVTALGHVFPKMGFLFVKDLTDTPLATKKLDCPGVLGANVFNCIVSKLGETDGPDFLKKLSKTAKSDWCTTLAMFSQISASKSDHSQKDVLCRARLLARAPVLIPARTIQLVECSVK